MGKAENKQELSTGVPTIQNVLKANGSHRAFVVTDEERTFFRTTIPCHEAAGNIIAGIAAKTIMTQKMVPKNYLSVSCLCWI